MLKDDEMEDEQLKQINKVIGMSERLHVKLNAELIGKGVEPIDVAIGAVHAITKVTAAQVGGILEAVEWMRNVIDFVEKQMHSQIEAGTVDVNGNRRTLQ